MAAIYNHYSYPRYNSSFDVRADQLYVAACNLVDAANTLHRATVQDGRDRPRQLMLKHELNQLSWSERKIYDKMILDGRIANPVP